MQTILRIIARIMARITGAVAALVLLLALGAAGLVWWTLPGGDLDARIPGLTAAIDIAIDSDGIPHVRAQTDGDAAAAIGFLHARERLFQMDLMRRAAAGELSEIAGPATLPLDHMARTLGVRRQAEADLASLPADTQALLDAYARGVNAWIARRGRFASLEFLILGAPRPWTPVDSLLWGKTMGLYLSGNWRVELARQALSRRLPQSVLDALWPPGGGAGHPEAALPMPGQVPGLTATATALAAAVPQFPAPFTLPDEASNEWAVDGAHSATGAPLLAGDPHLGFSLPGIWYLARIDTPTSTLAGATAPGVPFLVIGRNRHIAWTFTTTGADVQDLFVETPVGDQSYATPDGPRPFTVRTERIRVRGAPDEEWIVRETRHGPLVSDLVDPHGPLLALAMANLAPNDTAAAGLAALNRAASVAEAGIASAQITAPAQNLLVADGDGIGLFVTGRVPIRRSGDGSVPAPGADGSHDWIGFASGAQLPRIVAPASGRIVNANERVAPPDFPVFLGRDWYGDGRARRIRAMLDRTPHPNVADFTAMQADKHSSVAADLLPALRAVTPDPGLPAAAQALLANWDGQMAADLPQPLIFNAWMARFYQALLHQAGVPPGAASAVAPWPDLVGHALTDEAATLCGDACTTLLRQALADATADLAARFGPNPAAWRWGAAHQAVFAHPLLRAIPTLDALVAARIESPGDDTTVDRGGMQLGRFESVHGASFRGVYDLADLDRSRFVIAPGQSGHVFSPLARNFVQRWRDGATLTLGPTADHIAVHLHLLPEDATP